MANGDKDNTTAASKVTEMGLTGDIGVTSTGLAPDPNAVVLPERVLDLTNTKNLDALRVEAGSSPRATSVGKEGQKNYQPL